MSSEHSDLKQKELENMPKASHGYGGKFGVQQDRMDKARCFTLWSDDDILISNIMNNNNVHQVNTHTLDSGQIIGKFSPFWGAKVCIFCPVDGPVTKPHISAQVMELMNRTNFHFIWTKHYQDTAMWCCTSAVSLSLPYYVIIW